MAEPLRFRNPYIAHAYEGDSCFYISEFTSGDGTTFQRSEWDFVITVTRRKPVLNIGDRVVRAATGPRSAAPYVWEVAALHGGWVWLVPPGGLSDSSGVIAGLDDIEPF